MRQVTAKSRHARALAAIEARAPLRRRAYQQRGANLHKQLALCGRCRGKASSRKCFRSKPHRSRRPKTPLPRAPTSTGRWVIVDKGLSPAAKNAQPLDRISPMQHGAERMVNPVPPLFRLADFLLPDLSPVLLPYPRQNHTPLRGGSRLVAVHRGSQHCRLLDPDESRVYAYSGVSFAIDQIASLILGPRRNPIVPDPSPASITKVGMARPPG